MPTDSDEYLIYTDGSCSGTVGGWGFIIQHTSGLYQGFGGGINCTNNQMEMLAAIQALHMFEGSNKIKIVTDSQYVIHGITIYMKQWAKKKWITSTGKQVKNLAFWRELRRLQNEQQPEWEWVRGHSGVEFNEMADNLALRGREFAQRYLSGKREPLSSIHNCKKLNSTTNIVKVKDRLIYGKPYMQQVQGQHD